jgi:hypothetical protein
MVVEEFFEVANANGEVKHFVLEGVQFTPKGPRVLLRSPI